MKKAVTSPPGASLTVDLTEVLSLTEDCRYLKAKKCFNELLGFHGLAADWLPSNEVEAAIISRMIQREKECIQVLHDVSFDESKWILASTYFGITCHYQVEEDGIVQVRMEGNLEDLPLLEQAAVIHEVDFFKTWIPFCNDSKTVDKVGNADVVAYISLFIPPISRDTIMYAYAADCLQEANQIIISGVSIDSWKDFPMKPTGWLYDRMDVQKFLATIVVTGTNSAKTCIIAKVDPRTILPKTLVNIAVRNLAGVMLYYFQEKVKKVVRTPECEHTMRVQENQKFYRQWLLPRLLEFCQSKNWPQPVIQSKYWPTDDSDDRHHST